MIPLRENDNLKNFDHNKLPNAPPSEPSATSKKSTEAAKNALPYRWQKRGDPAVDRDAPWQQEGPIPLKGIKPISEQKRLEIELDEKRSLRKPQETKPTLPVLLHSDAFLIKRIKALVPGHRFIPEPQEEKFLNDLLLSLTPEEIQVLDNEDSPSSKLKEVGAILKIIAALLKIQLQEKELHQNPDQGVRSPLVHMREHSKDDDFLMVRIKNLLPNQRFASESQKEFLKHLIQTLSPEKVKVLAKNSPIAQRKKVSIILKSFAELLAKVAAAPTEEQFSLHMALSEQFKKLDPYLARSSLSSESIKKTALSFSARQAAISYAKSHPLIPLKTSLNEVSRVHNANKTLTAYFKKDAPLEPIFWKCVTLLKLERLFVGTQKATVITSDKKLVHGSVQYAQEGVLYRQALKNPKLPQPNKQAVHDGVAASIALGVFDLHGGNILVDKHGNIHMFDQTRSLPNTNLFLDRGSGRLVSPFRCALLSSEHSLTPLNPAERQALKETFQNILDNVEVLKNFFQTDYGLAMLSEVPPGWLDAAGAVAAMRARLERSLLVLEDPQVENLRDLCFAINPFFKFNVILSFAQLLMADRTKGINRSSIEIEKEVHRTVGKESFNDLLHSCAVFGFDLDALEEMAFGDTSMQEITDYITAVVTQNKLSKTSYDEQPMLAKYKANSGIDFKDFTNKESSSRIIKLFREQGIKIYNLDEDKKGPYSLPYGQLALTHCKNKQKDRGTVFSVALSSVKGIDFLVLDPLLTPNSYTLIHNSIPLSPLSPEEMVEFLQGRPFPSLTSEMESIDRLERCTGRLFSISHQEATTAIPMMKLRQYFIFHLKGSHPLRFYCLLHTAQGARRYEINTEDPDNYQLMLNGKVLANLGSNPEQLQKGLANII